MNRGPGLTMRGAEDVGCQWRHLTMERDHWTRNIHDELVPAIQIVRYIVLICVRQLEPVRPSTPAEGHR